MKKILHTLELTQDGLTVKATQAYRESSNRGHHQYVITNAAGHILRVWQTGGSGADGKLDMEDLREMIKDATRWLDDEDRELYGLS